MNVVLPIVLVAALVIVARRLFGHHPRMWTLHDGTYMTGCGCGWAGSPRTSRDDAEADIARHRTDPSARSER